jgi:hypothetical protein
MERFNATRALEQARHDAAGRPAAVFHRTSRSRWRVLIDAEELLFLLGYSRPSSEERLDEGGDERGADAVA